MKEPTLNITFDLIEHARTHPADPALIRAGQDISHAELDTMVWRVAQYLHDLGASAVPMSLRQRIRERICENLWVGYGTNETGLICVAQPPTPTIGGFPL
jgi:acyl-CoA synthetase (AMP-forming)/AMP-acid ligase II